MDLMLSSSRGVSVSSLALSFRFTFYWVWFVVVFVVVHQLVWQNFVGIENHHLVRMTMTHLVVHLVVEVQVDFAVEPKGAVVVV